MKIRLLLSAAILTVASSAFAGASNKTPVPQVQDDAAEAIPSPKENRIVRFTYSPDVIYRIKTTTAWHTHVELGEDEGLVENPMIGESAQWRVSGGPRNIYVKPVREDLTTSLTIVTNRRTYQFQLVSGKKGASVYQKVSFDYPEREAEVKLRQAVETANVMAENSRLSKQIIAPSTDPTNLNFGYDITGEAPFKPLTVYNDDRFTYLNMPNTQLAPAIFLVGDDGKLSLIEFKPPKKNIVVIERLVNALLLKVGNDEVRVSRSNEKKSWWQGAKQ